MQQKLMNDKAMKKHVTTYVAVPDGTQICTWCFEYLWFVGWIACEMSQYCENLSMHFLSTVHPLKVFTWDGANYTQRICIYVVASQQLLLRFHLERPNECFLMELKN